MEQRHDSLGQLKAILGCQSRRTRSVYWVIGSVGVKVDAAFRTDRISLEEAAKTR
jgi:hypothetical protein